MTLCRRLSCGHFHDETEDASVFFTVLVPVTRGVVFRADNQSPTFLGSAVDGLYDVDEFLLILQHPVEFVVISRPKIAHHVFVSEEKHDRHGVV